MLQKFGQMKVILPLVVLTLINLALFSLPGIPGSTPSIISTATDLKIPDMMGLYSPVQVYSFLEAIGPSGRAAFQTMHLIIDLAFPLVYGTLLFAILCRNVHPLPNRFHLLPFLAWITAAADLAENFTLVAVTAHFPDFLPGLTRLAQIFTLVKFSGILFCLLVMIFLGVKKSKIEKENHQVESGTPLQKR